jgi:hypothetical protein
MRTRLSSTTFALIGFVLFACGGGKPPATPASEPAPAAASAEPAAEPKPAAKPAETPSEDKPSRSPRTILTDADLTFVLAFDQSEPGKAAEQKCSAAAKGDAKKATECMTRARDKIQPEAMRFREDEDQSVWWQSLQRKGGSWAVASKVQVELGDETDRSIVVKTKVKTGTPKETVIEIPNNYSIAIKDPQHGRLVYEARIGPPKR